MKKHWMDQVTDQLRSDAAYRRASTSILREFFHALGIYRGPMKAICAAQYLADGGKLPGAVVENVVRGNALLSRMKAMG